MEDTSRKNTTDASAKVIDTNFIPRTITVEAGATVNWEQTGDQPHSVTAADGSFDSSPKCGPIDSDKCLGMGDTFSYAFDEPGEFTYYCRVHGLPDGTGMVGTVVVR
ncbi:MAG: cupredoxin domain-containing protein [Actinomycetota bacterium]